MAQYKIIDANFLRRLFCDMLDELHDDGSPEAYSQEIGAKKFMDKIIEKIEEGDITK